MLLLYAKLCIIYFVFVLSGMQSYQRHYNVFGHMLCDLNKGYTRIIAFWKCVHQDGLLLVLCNGQCFRHWKDLWFLSRTAPPLTVVLYSQISDLTWYFECMVLCQKVTTCGVASFVANCGSPKVTTCGPALFWSNCVSQIPLQNWF